MNATAHQFDLRELLAAEGVDFARGCGGHLRCPRCGKQSLSVILARAFFKCHNPACDFKGNSYTLARAQGRIRNKTPRERRLRHQAYNEAREGAAWLEGKSRARRMELYEAHRSLLRILAGAIRKLKAEPDHDTAWSALAYVRRELPRVRAELALLEESYAGRLLSFLTADERERAAQIDQVVMTGGIRNWEEKFTAVEY